MGKRVTTVSGIAGLGTLLAGVGAPKVIEGLPPWVNIALFAGGAALILAAFISHLIGRKDEAGTVTQTVTGDLATQIGTARDVHIHHPPPPPANPPIQAVARPVATRRSGRGEQIARRMLAEEATRCPEMPVWEALHAIAGRIGDTDEDNGFPEARRQFRQAALERRIEVWGQQDIPPAHMSDERHREVWTRIGADHWAEFKLARAASIEACQERPHTKEEELGRRGGRYWNLKVRPEDIKRRWPTQPRSPTPSPAPRASTPRRDTPLGDAVVYACFGRWDADRVLETVKQPEVSRLEQCLADFEQAAKDEDLVIWGKLKIEAIYRRDVWDKIPSSHWTKNQINFGSVFLDPVSFTEPRNHRDTETDQWQDLMVSKQQVVQLWPNGGTANDEKR